tara:strand:- start:450 stop:647 length:198 start_codon:yes stop_codon:yes gene_type:complete
MIKIIGGIIFAWGLLDLGLYYIMDMDLYYALGIYLPDIIWQWSGFIALFIGGTLYSWGDPDEIDN